MISVLFCSSSGKPAAGWDKKHPDWVPSKFAHAPVDEKKTSKAMERYDRSQFLSRKRKRDSSCADLSSEMNESCEYNLAY